MSEEDAILEEAMDNLGESIQRLRAIQNRLHSTGLDKHLEYRDLLHRVGSALAMSEAAFMEAGERPSAKELTNPLSILPVGEQQGLTLTLPKSRA